MSCRLTAVPLHWPCTVQLELYLPLVLYYRQIIGSINQKTPIARDKHPCPVCRTDTSNPKYCSNSCAAVVNNTLPRNRMKPKLKVCTVCNNAVEKYSKKCQKCKLKTRKQQINAFGKKIISEFHSTYARHRYQKIRHHAHRVAAFHGLEKKCTECGYTLHVELCHKKPISQFSKNTRLHIVNSICNLLYLCRTHHWELEHGYLVYK